MNAYEFCPVLMSSSWTSFFSECLHQYPGIHFAYSCHCTSFFSFSSLSQKIIQFFPFPSYFQFFISDFTCLSLFVIRYSCLKYLHWLFWRYFFHWLIMFSHWMFFNFIDCSKFLLLCVSLLYLLKHCGSLIFFSIITFTYFFSFHLSNLPSLSYCEHFNWFWATLWYLFLHSPSDLQSFPTAVNTSL